MDKKVIKGPSGPSERTWSFSFALTRTDPDGSGEAAAAWRKSLTMLDLVLVGAGLVLFLLEPVAVYMFLTHYKGPLLAEKCAPSPHVVVYNTDPAVAPTGSDGSAPGGLPGEGAGDVITPLNVRDPSALVMTPYPAPPPRRVDEGWKEALRAAAAGGPAKKAPEDEEWNVVVREAIKAGKADKPAAPQEKKD